MNCGVVLVLVALLAEATAQGKRSQPKRKPGNPGDFNEVSNLSEEDNAIVDYALARLGGTVKSGCPRKILEVRNFQRQVVGGTRYRFNVDLGSDDSVKKGAHCERVPRQTCSVEVVERAWEKKREITWDKVACYYTRAIAEK